MRQRHTTHTGARPRCLAAAVEQKVASRRRQTQRRASTMKEIRGKSVAARPATWAGAAESANAESGGDEEPVRAHGDRKATTARRQQEDRGSGEGRGADCIAPCLHERTTKLEHVHKSARLHRARGAWAAAADALLCTSAAAKAARLVGLKDETSRNGAGQLVLEADCCLVVNGRLI